MNERYVFRLFASCTLTAGNSRALITDMQRGCYYTVPLGLYHLLHDRQGRSIDEVLGAYEAEEDKEILRSYFDFLLEHELIFICPEALASCFPATGKDFDVPARIANAIIVLDKIHRPYVSGVLSQLASLNCLALEIVLTPAIDAAGLLALVATCEQMETDELHLIAPYTAVPDPALLAAYHCLHSLKLYQAPGPEEPEEGQLPFRLSYTTGDLSDHRHCGIVKETYFTPDLDHYTESLQYNTCLNRKVSIDAEGNIRNCPSMPESYGNIKEVRLADAIALPAFRRYWHITKEEIHTCKDCEFRHICTDCRAYLEDPSDTLSKPLKCGYSPYSCTWEDWSTHPLKQQAIDFYDMRDLIARGS